MAEAGGAAEAPAQPLNSETVAWVVERGRRVARLPAAAIDEFIAGEQQRLNGVRFYKRGTGGVGTNEVLLKRMYCCQYGPEDNRPAEREAQIAAALKRGCPRSAAALARRTSTRVGCKVRFTFAVYSSQPDVAMLTRSRHEHTGHDLAAGADAVPQPGRPSFLPTYGHSTAVARVSNGAPSKRRKAAASLPDSAFEADEPPVEWLSRACAHKLVEWCWHHGVQDRQAVIAELSRLFDEEQMWVCGDGEKQQRLQARMADIVDRQWAGKE